MDEIRIIGRMDHTMDNTFESANRVYGKDGLCPTLPTQSGGGHMPKVMDIVAMRGRNPENPSDRRAGIELEQRLELNEEGIANTITTVQKDNMVLERTVRVRQATSEGSIECQIGGGGGSELSRQRDKKRTGPGRRTDMSDTDNGEYP